MGKSERDYFKAIKFSDAKKEYNFLFTELGLDYLTIGTDNSCYKNTKYWNLRDLVSEAEYQYSCFFNSLKLREFDLLLSSDREEMNRLIFSCRKLKEFIDKYKLSILSMSSFDKHSSRFDRLSLNA